MILSETAILEEYEKGNIIIDPFDPDMVNPQSVDVRLGEWISAGPNINGKDPLTEYGLGIKQLVSKQGRPMGRCAAFFLSPIHEEDSGKEVHDSTWNGYYLSTSFTLAHTEEFIGIAAGSGLCCELKLKSTLARMGLDHANAGWIDQGYFNRITLELYSHQLIELRAGMKIAQVVFHRTEGEGNYEGKYQKHRTLEEVKRNWKPEDMLPDTSGIYK